MSCGVGHRRSSDPAWLWLWHRPAATALIQPLTWELPYAAPAALKSKKEKKKERNCLWISFPDLSLGRPTQLLLEALFRDLQPISPVPRIDSWLHLWVMSGQRFTHVRSSQLLSPCSSDRASYLLSKENKSPNSLTSRARCGGLQSSNQDVPPTTSWPCSPAPAPVKVPTRDPAYLESPLA